MTDIQKIYDHIYGRSEGFVYGEPASAVVRIADERTSGSVLDLGSGDGRNAIFLAAKGFSVKAVDISPVGIDKLKKFAAEKGLSIETELADLSNWSFDRAYDSIVTTFVFQHMDTQAAMRILQEMKQHTKPGGINALSVFMKDSEFFRRETELDKFYVEKNWLKEFYADWEIINYEEVEVEAKWKDGSPIKNRAAMMLARKP